MLCCSRIDLKERIESAKSNNSKKMYSLSLLAF